MNSITLDVLGMTCSACSARIEKVLNKKDGVENANVNLLDNKATIEFDEEKISTTEIVQAIEKTGYDVAPKKITLLVEGMTCAACSSRIEKNLNKLEGVVKANVDLSNNR